jgi:hypothetical protein
VHDNARLLIFWIYRRGMLVFVSILCTLVLQLNIYTSFQFQYEQGIPNEAYAMGWTSLKWVAIQVGIMIMWSGSGLRSEYTLSICLILFHIINLHIILYP